MSLSNTIKVQMPKEKITFKKGKGDCIYVYYTLRSYIANNLPKLKNDVKKQNLTVQEVLLELEKIKLTTLNNNKTTIMPLTSLQKNILKTYGISDDMNKVLEII